MDTDALDSMLEATLEDRRLSRAERSALAEVLAGLVESDRDLDQARSRAFAVARELLHRREAQQAIAWLEEVVKLLLRVRPPEQQLHCEAVFSPGEACVRRVGELLRGARTRVEVCVFTITDNRISREILAAHQRGVTVRVISDDEKAWDKGSDVPQLVDAGVPLAVDSSPAHMHHKFAIFDQRMVATGSYNWTRSASRENQENLVVCDHPPLVRRFSDEFETLWQRFTNP